jgi:hypothetical protein
VEEVKSESYGLVFQLKDRDSELQCLSIPDRFEEVTRSTNDGKPETFFRIPEKFLRLQAEMAEEFFYPVVAISKVGNKVDNSIRVRVTESNGNGNFYRLPGRYSLMRLHACCSLPAKMRG